MDIMSMMAILIIIGILLQIMLDNRKTKIKKVEDLVDTIIEREEEIERLNKDNGDITKLFAKEREETKRLNSIIKEAREYIGMCSSDDEAIICIENILDKVEDNK